MSNMKRTVALLMVCVLFLMAFSGCAPKEVDNSEDTKPETTVTEKAEEAKPEELKHVDLKMYVVGGGDDDNDIVWGSINEDLGELINTTVDTVVIPMADREQKVPLILASGETYDIMFIAAWNFLSTVADGAYVPLDDMLPEYGPNLLKNIPEVGWNVGAYEGKKYMVPKNETEYQNFGIIAREDLREKYNAPEPKDYASTLEYLKVIKENEPNMIPYDRDTTEEHIRFYLDTQDMFYLDILKPVLSVDFENFDTVHYNLEEPAYREYIDFCRECYLNGYWSTSVLSKQTSARQEFENGKTAMAIHNVYTASQFAKKIDELNGGQVEYYSFDDGNKANLMGYKAGNAISITSPNPERALMFLDVAQTNQTVYNKIQLGLEDTHYTMNDQGQYSRIEGAKYPAYVNRAFYNSNIQPADAGEWPRYREVWDDLATRAVENPLVPYKTNTDAIDTEIAAINNLVQTWLVPLEAGVLDPDEVWEEMMEDFEKAGIQTIIDEVQSQLDTFTAELN